VTQRSLESFGAYKKAQQLFSLVVDDMEILQKDSRFYRLVAQQVAAADSICANIEEGHGRPSQTEYARYLVIALGSARESRGRYTRIEKWLPKDVAKKRIELIDEIIAILSATIPRLRNNE
jgi:four helix bundle protein